MVKTSKKNIESPPPPPPSILTNAYVILTLIMFGVVLGVIGHRFVMLNV